MMTLVSSRMVRFRFVQEVPEPPSARPLSEPNRLMMSPWRITNSDTPT